MKAADLPSNEDKRIKALERYDILDTPADSAFDALTTLAAHIAGCEMARVSFVDTDRQWFKSRYGIDTPETPRDVSLCGHVVAEDDILDIESLESGHLSLKLQPVNLIDDLKLAIATLKSDPTTRDIPVIFMTARVQHYEISEYLAAGALGTIQKPFDPLTLPQTILDILDKTQ